MTLPEKIPEIIYKYRNWNDCNHKNILFKNELYFASSELFNDPFDCKIPEDFSLLDNNEKIKAYINKKRVEFGNKFKEGIDVEKVLFEFEQKLRNDPYKVQEESEALLFPGISKNFGFLSLSERWNSILMWSHYANHHQGYCIGFWQNKLQQLTKGISGRVTYSPDNKFPELSPLQDNDDQTIVTQTNFKSIDWKYEEEYRLTKVFYPNIDNEENRKLIISDDCFAEIVIGINTNKKDQDQIIEMAKKKNIKIFQAEKIRFRFEIGRKEIQT